MMVAAPPRLSITTCLLLVFGQGFLIDGGVLALLALNQYALAVLTPSGWLLSMTGYHRAEVRVMLIGLVLMDEKLPRRVRPRRAGAEPAAL